MRVPLAFAVTAVAALGIPGCGGTPTFTQVDQRGLRPAPSPPRYDGQPLTGPLVFEAHAGATAVDLGSPVVGDGAAVARHSAGAGVLAQVGDGGAIGVTADVHWAPTATTGEGAATAGALAGGPAFDVALALRYAAAPAPRHRARLGGLRLGLAVDLGGHDLPIRRGLRDDGRTRTLLARIALVPSYRSGGVTAYATVGMATESAIPATITIATDDDGVHDPGHVAGTDGLALALGGGLAVELGAGCRLTAAVGHARGVDRYGPRLDVGFVVALDGGVGARP